jgi:hypothetical protein
MAQGKRRILRITLFTLLFILIFMLARFFVSSSDRETNLLPGRQVQAGGAGVAPLTLDTAKTSSESLTTAQAKIRNKGASAGKQAQPLRSALAPDTAVPPESTAAEVMEEVKDVTPPYVQAEPGPGLHPAPIRVRLFADEPAVISIRAGADTSWKTYQDPIPVKDSLTLFFKGVDKAGNASEEVCRRYIIAGLPKIKCPPEMAAVETPKAGFCIDRYEWPNKKGAMPTGFINWYMAYDSCRAIKKRLCTADEWSVACGGRELTAYPYGNSYEIRTCNTEGNGPAVSGSLPECRSFFGVYDLSGNLREWTSTFSSKNDRHYQVYGGFWENRGTSRCTSTQYSFFPENKFVTIGFRCCKDAE